MIDSFIKRKKSEIILIFILEDYRITNKFSKSIANQSLLVDVQTPFYTKKIRIPVDKANVFKNNLVPPQDSNLVLDYLDLDLKTSQLEKKDIMILDLIETNNWERPIYFAITIGSRGRSFLYLDKYFQ